MILDSPLVAFWPILAPLALGLIALLGALTPGRSPGRVLGAARVVGPATVLIAAAALAQTLTQGAWTTPLFGFGEIGLSLRFDALSAAMFLLVAFLGAVVLRFGARYLEGDARHGAFVGRLALTIAAVMLLILAGNVVQLAAAWLGTSLALHGLLLFYPERTGAVIAARKKAFIARIGDLSLITAAALLWRTFGTTDIATIGAQAATLAGTGDLPIAVPIAAALVILTAVLKSAQFPTWGWLAEVMETPTPVSALLHAGILNRGTFLVARLSPVLLLVPTSLHVLAIIGGVTAVLAALVMLTQPSVKGALAYSSAAHMGFTLFLCGLGAFPVAMLHLIAHSCYKAHAFLSSGSAVEVLRASQLPAVPDASHRPNLLLALLLAVLPVAGIGLLTGSLTPDRPVLAGVALLLVLGLWFLLARAQDAAAPTAVLARSAGLAVMTSIAFFGLEHLFGSLIAPVVPIVELASPVTYAILATTLAAFAGVIVLQLMLPSAAGSPRLARFWVAVRHGFYANARFDRLVGALRVGTTSSLMPERS